MNSEPLERPPRKRRNLGTAFFIIGLFLVGTVLIFYLSGLQQKVLDAPAVAMPPAIVSSAEPALSLTGLDGSAVSLADYRGKVVLVNNWATWCPPCKAEMPELETYYEAHEPDGFVLVGIESGEPASTVTEFIQTLELSFPIWLDPDAKAVDAFKNWDLPSSYVIDRAGTIRMSWTGPVTQITLEKYVTPLLEK